MNVTLVSIFFSIEFYVLPIPFQFLFLFMFFFISPRFHFYIGNGNFFWLVKGK